MLKMSDRVSAVDSVVSTGLEDGSVILLKLDGTDFYTLNVTAARIWSLMKEGKDISEIIRGMGEEYDIDNTSLARSVLCQLEEFVKEGLAIVAKNKPGKKKNV